MAGSRPRVIQTTSRSSRQSKKLRASSATHARNTASILDERSLQLSTLVRSSMPTKRRSANSGFLPGSMKSQFEMYPGGPESPPEATISIVSGGASIFLPMAGLVDIGAERDRLNRELEEARQEAARAAGHAQQRPVCRAKHRIMSSSNSEIDSTRPTTPSNCSCIGSMNFQSLDNEVDESFFVRDVNTVARDLIGRRLRVVCGGQETHAIIVETEAYGDASDPASHAAFRPGGRAAMMAGRAGLVYVYLPTACILVSTS